MSKQIEEVMGLVAAYSYATNEVAESNTAGQLEKAHAKAIAAHKAIEAKLRELLPVWHPIESSPKDGTEVITYVKDFGTVQTAWYSQLTKLWPHGQEFTEDGDPCNIGEPTHWMPLPKAPE